MPESAKTLAVKRGRDPKENPLVMNVVYTQYEVLKDVGDE